MLALSSHMSHLYCSPHLMTRQLQWKICQYQLSRYHNNWADFICAHTEICLGWQVINSMAKSQCTLMHINWRRWRDEPGLGGGERGHPWWWRGHGGWGQHPSWGFRRWHCLPYSICKNVWHSIFIHYQLAWGFSQSGWENTFIVFQYQLMKLFQVCVGCGAAGSGTTSAARGTALYIMQICKSCKHVREWSSQPI